MASRGCGIAEAGCRRTDGRSGRDSPSVGDTSTARREGEQDETDRELSGKKSWQQENSPCHATPEAPGLAQPT